MSQAELLNGTKSTICLLIDHVEPLRDLLAEMYCSFQYGLTLEQMLIEGDDENPDLKTKEDFVEAMQEMIMFDSKWEMSFMEHIMNNYNKIDNILEGLKHS